MKIKLNERRREALVGLFYILPFAIGTLAFFIFPVISSLLLSFGDFDSSRPGFHIILSGLQNYKKAFFEDANFIPLFIKVVKNTLVEIPLIIVFSLVIAVVLGKVDRFKGFFRVVAVLPFLLGTGEVMLQLTAQGIDRSIISLNDGSIISMEFVSYLGDDIVSVLSTLFGAIIKALWSGGVQILLFLSAVQNISPSLYESARLDGANEYEMFFKITLPMISPVLLLNVIYTIVNTFTSSTNSVLSYIQSNTLLAKHGFAAAMGWVYFAFIILLVGLLSGLIGRYIKSNQTAVSR